MLCQEKSLTINIITNRKSSRKYKLNQNHQKQNLRTRSVYDENIEVGYPFLVRLLMSSTLIFLWWTGCDDWRDFSSSRQESRQGNEKSKYLEGQGTAMINYEMRLGTLFSTEYGCQAVLIFVWWTGCHEWRDLSSSSQQSCHGNEKSNCLELQETAMIKPRNEVGYPFLFR